MGPCCLPSCVGIYTSKEQAQNRQSERGLKPCTCCEVGEARAWPVTVTNYSSSPLAATADRRPNGIGHSSRGSSPSWPGQESCEEAEASLPPPPTSANLIFHFFRARQTAHQVRGLGINTTTDHTMLSKERILPKTILEILFVTFAVSETRTGRLSSANTAALYTPIHLRFVKAKHLFLPAVACENKQELVLLITVRYRKKNLGNSLGKPKVNYNSGRITARSGHSFILHWLRRADAPRMHFLLRRKKESYN